MGRPNRPRVMNTPEDWAREAVESGNRPGPTVLYPPPGTAKLEPADVVQIRRSTLIGLFAACAEEAKLLGAEEAQMKPPTPEDVQLPLFG